MRVPHDRHDEVAPKVADAHVDDAARRLAHHRKAARGSARAAQLGARPNRILRDARIVVRQFRRELHHLNLALRRVRHLDRPDGSPRVPREALLEAEHLAGAERERGRPVEGNRPLHVRAVEHPVRRQRTVQDEVLQRVVLHRLRRIEQVRNRVAPPRVRRFVKRRLCHGKRHTVVDHAAVDHVARNHDDLDLVKPVVDDLLAARRL